MDLKRKLCFSTTIGELGCGYVSELMHLPVCHSPPPYFIAHVSAKIVHVFDPCIARSSYNCVCFIDGVDYAPT